MCDHLHLSDKLARVRDKLTAEKVQLWTLPYYVTGIGPSDSDLQVKIRKQNYSNNNMNFIFPLRHSLNDSVPHWDSLGTAACVP